MYDRVLKKLSSKDNIFNENYQSECVTMKPIFEENELSIISCENGSLQNLSNSMKKSQEESTLKERQRHVYYPNNDEDRYNGPEIMEQVKSATSTNIASSTVNVNESPQDCNRIPQRRNAVDDPLKLPLSQENRERIEKELENRRTSFKRKVSQKVLPIISRDIEIDLF